MKKNLLATSALIAAGVLASQGALAEAKPISIMVGGYYEQWVGLIFQDSDVTGAAADITNADDLDVQEDGEIHFVGSMTTDNGLTFGVNVQLEASTSGDQIDENYLFVRGSFGEIVLGSENGPAYTMHYGVDIDQGIGLEEGDAGLYWFRSTAAAPNNQGGTHWQLHTTRNVIIDNDAQKIRWISPRMSGLQIGMSYAPEARDDKDDRIPNEFDNANTFEQIVAAAVNFDQQFDNVRVRASVGGQYVGDPNGGANGSEDSVWAVSTGIRIGAGGFEAAVAYSHTNGAGPADAEQVDVVGAGISYKDGPMGVSLTGAYGSTNNDEAAGRDAQQLLIQLGLSYQVGPGVSINGAAIYANSTDLIASDVDFTGFGVVGGVKLNF
jgi:outer membrane protein OmpU